MRVILEREGLRGNEARGSGRKHIVFGLLKQNEKVYTEVIKIVVKRL